MRWKRLLKILKLFQMNYLTPIFLERLKLKVLFQELMKMNSAGSLKYCWWKCKIVQPLWKRVWQFLIELNIYLLHDPEIPLPDIYPREMKTCPHKDLYVNDYIIVYLIYNNRVIKVVTLFIKGKRWKQPQCPWTSEWSNKLWCSQIMEYCSAMKRNELCGDSSTAQRMQLMIL